MKHACAVFMALVTAVAPVSAQSLKDLRARESEERALEAEAAFTGKICGTSISASIDWSSTARWPAEASLADACDGALGAVETMCRSGRTDMVDDFTCAGDGSGPNLSGGSLRYGASPGSNSFSETKSYLEAH